MKRLVSSSEGKTEVVTPISAPMLVIVARSGTVSVSTPGPSYSTIAPTLPLVPKSSSILSTTSLAPTHGPSSPVSQMRYTRGVGM